MKFDGNIIVIIIKSVAKLHWSKDFQNAKSPLNINISLLNSNKYKNTCNVRSESHMSVLVGGLEKKPPAVQCVGEDNADVVHATISPAETFFWSVPLFGEDLQP